MDKEKLNELLDRIYELEGLVHLAIARDDAPDKLPELIRKKSEELMSYAEQATTTTATSQSQAITNIGAEAEFEEAMDANISSAEETQSYGEDTHSYGEETHSYEEATDSHAEEPVEHVDETSHAEEIEELKISEMPPIVSITEPVLVEKPVKETYKFDDYTAPRGRLVFSINDRYRFKRELFNSSDVDFNTTLSLVASMEGYEEAEDYFLTELQWDEKSQDVIDFLEVLKKYFKE